MPLKNFIFVFNASSLSLKRLLYRPNLCLSQFIGSLWKIFLLKSLLCFSAKGRTEEIESFSNDGDGDAKGLLLTCPICREGN